MSTELRLTISEDDADGTRLAELTRYLRADLLQLEVDDVSTLPGAAPPPGSRAFGSAEIGALLVMLSQSADALQSVVAVVTAWAGRGGGARRTVRLELDGDALELSQASAADQERLISLFVSRHSGPGHHA
jgi:hypothetical protein